MANTKTLNHDFATLGNGSLLIWWGLVFMFDSLTIGMGAIGTGLIMLSVNAARLMNGITTRGSTTVIGILALVWGTLDTVFSMSFEVSFAMMLIVFGLITIASLLTPPKAE